MKINYTILRLASMACIALMTLILGSAAAMAQRWEVVLGDPVCRDAGRGGVHSTSDGGYIAVGETFGPDCNSSDIYAVVLNNDGTLFWSNKYNIGHNDSALDVEEVRRDPNNVGGYIITGVTSVTQCPGNRRDIFLLRIDRCGALLWVKVYGNSDADDVAWDVIEAMHGDPNNGTNPGDFVVAGWRIAPNSQTREGYIMRTNSVGNVLWGNHYNGPQDQDDYFYSIDEATVNVPPNGVAADFVAAGGSNSFTPSYDGWIVRVNGNTGAIINSCVYGGQGFEEFRSVVELNMGGATAGSIVAVGSTNTGLQNSDVYLVRVPGGLGAPLAQRTLGDNANLPDEGLWVREVGDPAGLESDVIVTGYVTPPQGVGFGGADVFLQHYNGTALNPTAPVTVIYGGVLDDWGWSVGVVNSVPQCKTSGYIVCGFTKSPLNPNFPNDPEQMYLIKTDAARSSNCDRPYNAIDKIPQYPHNCNATSVKPAWNYCNPQLVKTPLNWWYRDCFTADGTCLCPMAPCPQPNGARWNPGGNPGNEPAPDNDPAPENMQAPDNAPAFSNRMTGHGSGALIMRSNPIEE